MTMHILDKDRNPVIRFDGTPEEMDRLLALMQARQSGQNALFSLLMNSVASRADREE